MWTKIKNLLTPPEFEDAEKTLTARILYAIVLITITGTVFTLIAANLVSSGPSDNTSLYNASAGVILVFLILLGITRLGYISYSSWALVISSFIGLHYILWNGDGLHDLTILAYPLIIALAGLLLGRQAIIVSSIVALISMVGLAYGESSGQIIPSFSSYDYLYLVRYSAPLFLTAYVLYMTIGILVQSRNRAQLNELTAIQKNRELEEIKMNLELRVTERTADLERGSHQLTKRATQLEAIADVARSIATLHDMDQLLPYITKLVSESFGFYHTGIFLLDENKEFAILRAANSEGGQKMLARKHQLRIGQEGVVGFAIAAKKAHIALDVGEDPTYFNNPDLPATRSEMALPLVVGSDVIGALDVQSEQPGAFSDEDIKVISTLANLIAIAIENARLFERSQQTAKELENTLQRYIRREWGHYSGISTLKGYRAFKGRLEPITKSDQADIKQVKNGTVYKAPVTLRSVSIGTLDINLGKNIKEYSQEEIDIIQATADRIALALESARLLEESQKRASKEQIIGEISTKIGAAINLDSILQTSLRELSRILPGAEIAIQVENE
jgi:GAF domain-containing protein